MARTVRLGWAGPVILLLAGACGDRPSAPALVDEPIYRNAQEGFRLLAPEGWTVAAKADLPPGPVEKERLLVQYRRAETPHATFEISLADLPEGTDLPARLAQASYGADAWKPAGPPETLTLNGTPAQRFALTGKVGKNMLAREVTTVRRGGRVYFFTCLYLASDPTARDQVRRSVERVVFDAR
jgi:hypothetical protein